MNGVMDRESAYVSHLLTFYQSTDISDQIAELAHTTAEYAMALDEALEGLVAAQRALQDLQASSGLHQQARQRIEQGGNACAALITAAHAQLVPLSDDLHAQLRQWAEYTATQARDEMV
jgi:hypothetical protein